MTVLRKTLVVLHFVGPAAPLGGFLTRSAAPVRRVVPATLRRGVTRLVSGLALDVASKGGLHEHVHLAKIAAGPAMPAGAAGLFWANRVKEEAAPEVFHSLGRPDVVNIVVAVFWTRCSGRSVLVAVFWT